MNVRGIQSGFQAGASGVSRADAAKGRNAAEPASIPGANGKAKGVVRLLQEGHFKGVADIRLRINFQDQIGAANAAATEENFAAAIAEFEANIEVAFTNFLEGFVPTEEQGNAATELFNTFKATVSDIANAFLGSGGGDIDAFVGQLESDFEAFIIDLQTALEITPPAPANDVEPVEVTTDIPEEVSVENSFLDDFRAAFAEELSALVDALQKGAQELPELSSPNGNGQAYAKFLEILEGLQAPEPAESDPNTATIEDILA